MLTWIKLGAISLLSSALLTATSFLPLLLMSQ